MSDALRDHVSQQTTLEAQRKSSIESKSFSILTASLALITLYIALSNQTQLEANLRKASPRDFLLVALVAAVCSIVAALWAARPIAYPTVSIDDLNDARGRFRAASADSQDTPESIADELLEAQIRDLKEAREINTCRAKSLYAGLVLLGIETIGLIVSLSLAASS
jgi:hypothetical protein